MLWLWQWVKYEVFWWLECILHQRLTDVLWCVSVKLSGTSGDTETCGRWSFIGNSQSQGNSGKNGTNTKVKQDLRVQKTQKIGSQNSKAQKYLGKTKRQTRSKQELIQDQ